ncbi:glutamate 5-kinase [Facklamia miroungae]|uniref:Glutamate 5-kinase n=1 Tax=Facklamia miroungae TaxID=120956 RepID=A0A1G7T768_9LACT|nr:glutamate 5-kinase [Facklamia miroungae]NKZ29683.1 glutamate 5-kinase [Facklamia miroungae]SDG30864.1 glutamate 5-kinase [Facklamia miroungae]
MNRTNLRNAKRIIIKLGTNTILSNEGINFAKMDRLAYVCASLIQEGKEIVIVSSGAIGVGSKELNEEHYPTTIADQQVASAVGQTILMGHYARFFKYYGVNVGQILLTRDVIDYPQSLQNVQVAMDTLLRRKIVPIINENDAVAVEELNHQTKFGDNDTLSAIVAKMTAADLLVILSDVDGLYDSNPQQNPKARLIDQVNEMTEEIHQMALGKGSEFSTGGMATKLNAAEVILTTNSSLVITSGADPSIIFDILKGETIGTFFHRKGDR